MAESPIHLDHDPAYPDHLNFPGLPKRFSILSARKGASADPSTQASLLADLEHAGLSPIEVKSGDELSFLVECTTDTQQRDLETLAWKYSQESIIHCCNEDNSVIGPEGVLAEGKGFTHGPHLKSNYSQLPSGHRFQLNLASKELKKADVFDSLHQRKKQRFYDASTPHHYGAISGMNVFHSMHEAHYQLPGIHIKDPDDKTLEQTIEKAKAENKPSVVIHGICPPSLREGAPAATHPHAYDWHDGLEAFVKSVGEDTNAGKSPETYAPIAQKFGRIFPTQETNLHFYRGIEKLEPEIDALIRSQGYEVINAGGNLGIPNYLTHNYLTKHLIVFDPAQAGENDLYIRVWRKLHELAHALTLDEVNELYGPGKRVGALGDLSPREAKRAVHWEYLAGIKQKELAKLAGFVVDDTDASREINAVVQDAVYRIMTGRFSDASAEGFFPSNELIPIEVALKVVDDRANDLGLSHDEATRISAEVPEETMRTYTNVRKGEGESGPLSEGGKIKKFYLDRQRDSSGISGTGRVAEGVVFSNGWVGMNWLTRSGSVAFYPNVQALEQIHGHSGDTKIVYEDIEDIKKALIQGHTVQNAKEDSIVADQSKEAPAGTVLETPAEQKQEEAALAGISSKIKSLHDKVEEFRQAEIKEHLAGKDLVAGIEEPEKECPACENPASACVCYLNLPKPRIEVTKDGVNIFFKSEWDAEDIANFKSDLAKRAGLVLTRKLVQKARETAAKIKSGNKKD